MASEKSQWSAAFISWVATEAMRGIPDAFPARDNHLAYSQAIRTGNWGFTALNARTETPRVGDIIVYTRQDGSTGQSSTSLTFDSNPWQGPGHGDIVVRVQEKAVTFIGGNAGRNADKVSLSTTPLTAGKLRNRYLTILRPKSGAPAARIGTLVALAEQEFRAWNTNRLTDNMPQSFPYQAKYWRAVGQSFQPTVGTFSPTPSAAIVAPNSAGRGSPDISPFIAANDSLHPHIQYELTRRRNSAETIHSHMPFVKLTSLVEVYSKNIDGGRLGSNDKVAYCPTLGIHGARITSFKDLYTPKDNRSIVATATKVNQEGIAEEVNVVVENSEEDPPNIPPPGIVSMNCERSTAGGFGVRGGLFKANLSIKAYSIGQLNVLLKYFLRQGTKVVLEMGRMTSSPGEQSLFDAAGQTSNLLEDDPKSTSVKEMFQRFNWIRPKDQILNQLKPYVLLEKGQRDLIDGYTYNNLGNYELFIGYVATFKVNYTKENVYNIDLTIHSVQQFEVPTRLGGARSDPDTTVTVPNQCEGIDIMDYFSPTAAYRQRSFLRVLAKCVDKTASEDSDAVALSSEWGSHVVKLRSEGAQVGTDGIKRDAFLISWECFVNLILNDEKYGLLGTFQVTAGVDPKTLSVLRTGLISRIGDRDNRFGRDSDVNSNEVSWNKYLRSTDLNVLLINNTEAQSGVNIDVLVEAISVLEGGNTSDDIAAIREALTGDRSGDVLSSITTNPVVGSFDRREKNTSYLTKGIWINSNAIIQAFSDADTISQGIANLLDAMNNAVQGYWNLQLLSAEPEALGLHVIDAGLSKPVEKPLAPLVNEQFVALPLGETLVDTFKKDIAEFTNNDGTPKYLYSFNRKLKRSGSADFPQDTGSELLDIKYEADMPVVIAVQAVAGVGGTAQRGLLSSIDIKELRDIAMFDTFPTSSVSNNAPCPSDVTTGTIDIEQIPKSVLTDDEIRAIFNMASTPNQRADKEKSVDDYIKEITDAAYDRWLKVNTKTKTETVRTTRSQAVRGEVEEVEVVETREVPVAPDEQTQQQIRDALSAAATAIRAVPAQNFEQRNPGVLAVVRSYATSFGKAIGLAERDISVFIQQLDSTRKDSTIHPFNASNLTKTTIDLTLPGIGGILLFQAFQVERIPDVLKRGYYIVTKVVHEFSVENGWITKLTGRFRFKPNM